MSDASLFDLIDFAETRPAGVLDCGHSIHDFEHYSDCLALTCPRCGLTEPTPYRLYMEHSPLEFGHRDLCSVSMNAIDQSGCCLSCRSYTFGHSACIHEGCERYEPGHGFDFFQPDPVFCAVCGIPPRMIWMYNAW